MNEAELTQNLMDALSTIDPDDVQGFKQVCFKHIANAVLHGKQKMVCRARAETQKMKQMNHASIEYRNAVLKHFE